MKRLITILLLSLMASAQAQIPQNTITITGEGVLSLAPDQLVFSTHFTAREKDYETAMNVLNTKVNKLVATLKKAGVPEDEIKTGNFSINLWREYNKSKGRSEVLGFVASHSVVVRTAPDKKTLNGIFQAYMESGSDASFNMAFTIKDPEKYGDELLALAIKDAKRKGQVIAEAAEIKLGSVVDVVIQNNGGYRPMARYAMAEDAMSAKSVAMEHVNPEDMNLTQKVTVSFLILDPK